MNPGTEAHHRSGRLAIVVVAAFAALSAALPSGAMSSTVGDGVLSPRLSALATPSLRSASPLRQARALSLAVKGPGSLLRRGDRVLVDVRFEGGAAAGLDALRGAGARIVNVSRRYRTVTVAIAPTSLPRLGKVAGVRSVAEDLAPLVSATAPPPVAAATTPCLEGFGAATSEGDLQLNAMKARTAFGVDGSGVTVGILSDSFDLDPSVTTAAEDVATGDLPGTGDPCGHPTPVRVLNEPSAEDDPEPADEGRAMAQIVHDLAPGAQLAFATAFSGELAFAENIEKLAQPVGAGGGGAQVIVDDVSYLEEPFFQEGPVGVAVSKVTGEGVTYFSAAGNNNLIDSGGRNFGSWEAPAFRDSSTCPAAVVSLSEEFEEFEEAEGLPPEGLHPTHCMDFDPKPGTPDTGFRIAVAAHATLEVDLQWNEPWEGVGTDLDAFLIGPSNAVVAESLENNPGKTEVPDEFLAWRNASGATQNVQMAINRFSGTSPRLKFALLQNGGGVTETEYPESSSGPEPDVVGPTIFGHNGGTDTVSVGAIRYTTNSEPERFSSRGPVTHYFGPVTGAGPAAPISKQTLHKPDLVATDGGANTFFGSCVGSVWRFFGTSAAAPHAAGVAALELAADPSATVDEIKQAQVEEAQAINPFSIDDVGGGLLDAFGAVGRFASPIGPGTATGPSFAPPVCPPPAKATPPPLPPPPIPAAVQTPPSTSFALHPHRVVRTRRGTALVTFRFRSDQSGVTFLCSIDRGPFRSCRRRLSRHFASGPHVVRVAARNSAGLTDPTPAVFRFRVKRVG